ncbi:MAG: CHRD domain-containing protein [Actinomycetota bacterium]|nr:CHRD domain-containing protein [Actinomycetota bacterium]
MVRRLISISALSVAGFVGLAGPASAAEVFTTELQGEEEVPVRGDLDGSGFAVVAAIPEAGLVCYSVVVFGIAPATAAHIHEAPRGVAGPVVVDLDAPTSGGSGGCVADQEEAEAIAEDPSDYYVNVHNAEFPGGALRGQLG